MFCVCVFFFFNECFHKNVAIVSALKEVCVLCEMKSRLHLLFSGIEMLPNSCCFVFQLLSLPGVGFGQGVTWCVNDEGRGGQGSSADLWMHRSPLAKLLKNNNLERLW